MPSINVNLIKKLTKPKVKSAPKLGKAFHTLTCKCGQKEEVDTHTTSVICHTCVQKMCGSTTPTNVPKYTPEERKERKALIAKKKAAVLAKKEKFKGFPKGWWFKANYTHADGRKFEYGKEVKKFTVKAVVIKKASGMPRGWHLRKKFTCNGKTYSFGKEVK